MEKLIEKFDRTLFVTSEEDLEKIYDKELKSLQEKEFIIDCLKKLDIEDFPSNLSKESRARIEEALRILRIHDHLDIGGGLKLFGLNDLSSVKLSNAEQKLIRDHVEVIIKKETEMRVSTKSLEDKIQKGYVKFLDLQKQIGENVKTLEKLKKDELELSMGVAKILIGDDQKTQVKAIDEELELLELRVKTAIATLENNEMTKTKFAKEAFNKLSKRVDDQLKFQNE